MKEILESGFVHRYITFLPCDEASEAAEFLITKFEGNDKDIFYDLSIIDAYCGEKESKLRYRIRRAWNAFKGKPVYYSGICVRDKERIKKWFEECLEMINNS